MMALGNVSRGITDVTHPCLILLRMTKERPKVKRGAMPHIDLNNVISSVASLL